MELLRRVSEGLARKTSRRSLFGRGAGIATGALLGAAAGTITRAGPVSAGLDTDCQFPGPPCPCEGCNAGVCQKPCIIMTYWYASGCWVWAGPTCCDCQCNGKLNYSPGNPQAGQPAYLCGCGSDYHNNPAHCP